MIILSTTKINVAHVKFHLDYGILVYNWSYVEWKANPCGQIQRIFKDAEYLCKIGK